MRKESIREKIKKGHKPLFTIVQIYPFKLKHFLFALNIICNLSAHLPFLCNIVLNNFLIHVIIFKCIFYSAEEQQEAYVN